MKRSKVRVLMIGLDGCSLDLVSPWIQSGQLPTLARLLEKGAWGKLSSTIPSHSAPAWTSLVTGVNPGKHGIFDFMKRDTSVVTAADVKTPKLWNILSAHGFRCCVVNVPLTYPPDKIDGVMISGFPTPRARRDYAYPSSLLDLLEKNKYLVDAPFLLEMPLYDTQELAERRWGVLKEEYVVSERRVKTILDLLQSEPWDFVFVVFKESDDVQHLFWDKPDVLLEFYKKLDANIASIEEGFAATAQGDDMYVFVVSDHGFGPGPNTVFDLGTWIRMNTSMRSKVSALKTAMNEVSVRLIITPFFGHSLGLMIVKLYKSVSSGRMAMFIEKLAQASRDFRIGTPRFRVLTNGLYVNSAVFESKQDFESFVSELLVKLPRIDLRSQQVFSRVWRREDIYVGSRIEELPELIFTTNKEFVTCENAAFTQYLVSLPGTHFDCPNGILIMSGSGVKHQRIEASIYQVTPTVLYLFGISYENQFDAPAIADVFTQKPATYETSPKPLEAIQQEHAAFTEDEESALKERLRRLGYM